MSNLILNGDGSVRNLGGYSTITNTISLGREGIDERQIRFGPRLSFQTDRAYRKFVARYSTMSLTSWSVAAAPFSIIAATSFDQPTRLIRNLVKTLTP